jgi:hypothetical protein
LDEAHRYYKDAFEIIEAKVDRTKEETAMLVDILLQWAIISYRRCHFTELVDLLKAHEGIVMSLDDKERIGMFYARLGGAMNWSNNLVEAHAYLSKALKNRRADWERKKSWDMPICSFHGAVLPWHVGCGG